MSDELIGRQQKNRQDALQLLQKNKLVTDVVHNQEMPHHDLVETLVRKQNLGLNGRSKLILQSVVAVIVAVALIVMQAGGEYSTRLIVPFFKQFRPDLVITALVRYPHLWLVAFLPFIVFVAFVLVGCTNAVNLTDGLDGLAIGPVMTVAFCYWVFTYVAGNVKFADYLQIPHVVHVGELSIFCASLIAASLGFLWYNAYPASMMMGDVGALALGGVRLQLAEARQRRDRIRHLS